MISVSVQVKEFNVQVIGIWNKENENKLHTQRVTNMNLAALIYCPWILSS